MAAPAARGKKANTVILSEHMREGNAKICGKSGYRHLSLDFARDLPAANLRVSVHCIPTPDLVRDLFCIDKIGYVT